MNYKKILKIRTGSHLYGLNTPESDEDFIGIFLPSKEILFGLNKMEQIDKSIKSKDDSGKNTKEAIDYKLYGIRKFCKLALQNNPNIIEILFCNPENIIHIDDFGKRLLDSAHLFPYTGLKKRFLGYAFSQKKKMRIKKENYEKLKNALTFFKKQDPKKLIIECTDNLKIGELKFEKHFKIKHVVKILDKRINSVSRESLYRKYGYDTKYASHLIRLLYEAKELLTTGRIRFPLQYPELMEIKEGKWTQEDTYKLSEKLENEIKTCNSVIPEKPRFKEVQDLCISLISEYFEK